MTKLRKNSRSKRVKQKGGVGYSFKLDCALPGGRAEVVKVPTCKSELNNVASVQEEAQQQVQKGGKRRIRKQKGTGCGKTHKRNSNTRRRKTSSKRRRKNVTKSLRNRKRSRRRSRRVNKQKGGDYNCPSCNMNNRAFGCRQPLWDSKCV